MRKLKLFKSLLVVAMLLVGGVSSVWAAVTETVVVNQDFNDGTTTLFTASSRITVDNDNNARFTTADNSANGYSLATYDFSSAIGEGATSVKIEFDYYIYNDNSAYHRYFTIGDKSRRTGFGKQSYVTSGGMFAFGLKRGKFNGTGSNVNYWSINDGSTANTTANIIGAWAHVEVTINLSAKTSTYKFTSMDGNTTYYDGTDVAYMDGSASACNQIDFFDCANSKPNENLYIRSYLDNLKITKYVDDSKEATTYTVKYQNDNGTDLKEAAVYDTYVGDTYTASSADMATFYSTDTNKKYIYKSGNTSTAAVATATSNVITLVFDEYDKVDYTVTAKNGEETLGTLASGDAYTDGSTTVYWNKYKQYDSKWYVADETSYGKAISAATTNVAFTETDDIDYFFEAEDMTYSRTYNTYKGTPASNGSAKTLYGDANAVTTTMVPAGTYTVSLNGIKWQDGYADTYQIAYSTDNTNWTPVGLITYADGEEGVKTLENAIIPAEAYIRIWTTGGVQTPRRHLDYMTLKKTADVPNPISMTITSAGWATLYTDKALDFSDVSGLTAYTATCAENTVTLTPVSDVPANTGVVLKGAANTYNIPVISYSTTAQGDLEGNATEATAFDAFTGNDLYMLALNEQGNKVQFTKVTSESIAAGKAYLKIAQNAARMLSVVFDDGDATGITNATAEMKAEDAIFNLAGQRVAQPANGLYIVNGKKVLVK